MLIVGLGNPGKEYEATRHNVGYMFVDNLATGFNTKFSLKKTFQGYLAKFVYNNETHYILKPITYMNLSGVSVKKVCDYYHINPSDILIISDDLDMPTGKIRIRQTGSSGGHKGLKSIFEALNTENISRIKIGISNNSEIDTKDYVLGTIKGHELELIKKVIDMAPNIVLDMFNHDLAYVMNKYNGKVK